MSDRLPIAVLVSGAGTNLQALLDTVHGREADVVAVASSVADAPALDRARARDVPAAVFARADATPLPGFDENHYATAAASDRLPLPSLVHQLEAVRTSTLALFRALEASLPSSRRLPTG